MVSFRTSPSGGGPSVQVGGKVEDDAVTIECHQRRLCGGDLEHLRKNCAKISRGGPSGRRTCLYY